MGSSPPLDGARKKGLSPRSLARTTSWAEFTDYPENGITDIFPKENPALVPLTLDPQQVHVEDTTNSRGLRIDIKSVDSDSSPQSQPLDWNACKGTWAAPPTAFNNLEYDSGGIPLPSSERSVDTVTWESYFSTAAHSGIAYKPTRVAFSNTVVASTKSVLYFVTLGVSAASLDWVMDTLILLLLRLRSLLLTVSNMWEVDLGLWVAFSVIVGCMGVVWTTKVSPKAVGSGIPEMKAILSGDLGDEPGKYLQLRTLVSKVGGLVLSAGSGLSVGREGPFVHTSCIVALQLMKKIPLFHAYYDNPSLKRQGFYAACAVGISSTFAAPIGGLLFSIEVTSTFYLVANFWKSFVASVSGAIAVHLLNKVRQFFYPDTYAAGISNTDFTESSWSYTELPAFFLLGVICAGIAVAYKAFSKWARMATYNLTHDWAIPWSIVILACTAVLTFIPGDFSHYPFGKQLNDLFSSEPLGAEWTEHRLWDGNSIYFSLACIIVFRFLMTPLSTTLPIPAGSFIPSFVCGAAVGRVFGELMLAVFGGTINPGGYAVVGAASLVAGHSHTISSAVIAMEMTNQFIYSLPTLMAVLVCVGMSSSVNESGYDAILMAKRLPYLSLLPFESLYTRTAKDLMLTGQDLVYITQITTYEQLLLILKTHRFSRFPVVKDKENRLLLGSILRTDLLTLLQHLYRQKDLGSLQSDLMVSAREWRHHKVALRARRRCFDPRDDEGQQIDSPKSSKHRKRMSQVVDDMDYVEDDEAIRKLAILSGFVDLVASEFTHVDKSPLQIDVQTSMESVHILFEMMRSEFVFVTSCGALTGCISRKILHALYDFGVLKVRGSKKRRRRITQAKPQKHFPAVDDAPRVVEVAVA
jgi:H+/Cl- antiporter ClcA/CBS domain-containing protein